ncbi:MAG: inositol monophosphatase family protein [Kiloniellales bacterium]
MIPDLDRVSAIVREAAAAEVLPRFQALRDQDVWRKASGEVVSVADVEAERWLTRRLLDLLPGSMVIGEEASADRPALLDQVGREGPVWLIDPVDGTGSFIAGKPAFAVVVGLLAQGRCLAGWIHDPLADRMAVAAAAEGAWLDGERLRVAAPAPLSEMSGVLHLGCFDKPWRQRIRDRQSRLGRIGNRGCGAHEYMALAAGRQHFALFSETMPWDHAAGVLMHREAGGFAARLDGRAYRPTDHRGGLLLAPDPASWEALHGFLTQQENAPEGQEAG